MNLKGFVVLAGLLGISNCADNNTVQGQSEKKTVESVINLPNSPYVPQSVYDFRKELDTSNDLRDHVLVEIAPGMRKYLITPIDGSNVKHFAKVYLHIPENELDKLVSKRIPMHDFQRGLYLDKREILYKRAEILAWSKDCNNDSVLTSLELYNSFPCVIQK